MISWDESKRQRNLLQHGLDFADCESMFDHSVASWENAHEAYGELRH